MMNRKKTWNPIRGTIWLPADIKLDEIDFEPLPQDAHTKAETPLFNAEPSGTSLEAA